MRLVPAGAALYLWIETQASPTSPVPCAAPAPTVAGRVCGSRRVPGDAWPIGRRRAVSKRTGATLNDVRTTVCASAVRGCLTGRGAVAGRSLVALVPVSLAGSDAG